jgi:hypothetical protein
MPLITLSSEKTKSYASEKNLNTALTSLGFEKLRYLVCKTIEGKWTAVFIGADNIHVAHQGFTVVG